MVDARLLELIEAEAWADIFRAVPAALAEEHGIAALDLGAAAACIVARDVPSLMLNRVIGLGVGAAATPAMLDLADEAFGETRYMIPVAPQCQPAELTAWLRGRGFEAGYAWMKFERGPEPPPPAATSLEVRRVGPDDADAFAQALVAGYEMPGWMEGWVAELVGRPGWSCYVALHGAEPAAAGCVYIRPPAAWLGLAATVPELRRRGGQGAIMEARIREALAAGCSVIGTETGERVIDRSSASYSNIMRFGFREAYVRPNLVSPPDDEVA
ncbi:MAG TPA: GNAT family N-acetyltransferase [Gaiellales bacterium]|nr:GNAT family N-acetyltransferase [Gaiellales bacterium]